jgi:thymidine kinase
MSCGFKAKGGQGRLEVICGSMFSGKTEELMRRLKRAEFAKLKTVSIKPSIDNRGGKSYIASHDGKKRLAFSIENEAESIMEIIKVADGSPDVIGIDEVQFFSPEIIKVINTFVDQGKRVIAAGLDMDYRGEPFGVLPSLLSMADEILKLKAICTECGGDAHFSQRIINSQPAKYSDPTIMVGATECYQARCRNCFQIDIRSEFFYEIKPATVIQNNQKPVTKTRPKKQIQCQS